MTLQELEDTARLLQQVHAVFGFAAHALLPSNSGRTVEDILKEVSEGNSYSGVVFGFMGLAFVQSHDGVYKHLNKPASISNLTDPSKLNATVNRIGNGETATQACLRHLRNCFGHNQFTPIGDGPTMQVQLRDKDPRTGDITFEATCDVAAVSEMAERVLIAAHVELVAQLPPPPAASTP